MKILYITLEGFNRKGEGVGKKINAQIKALRKLNNEVDKLYTDLQYIWLEEENVLNIKKVGTIKNKYIKRLFFFSLIENIEFLKKYDCFYIRHFMATPSFIKFLDKFKDKKIIIEIPTYPVEGEYKTFSLKIMGIIDEVFRKKLYSYVSKIVTYSQDKTIYGVNCINVSNGIDLEENKLIKKEKNKKYIEFVSVSLCFFWHGIDRFLYSLLQYRKNGGEEKIKFHIVGEGIETPKLKKIVEDNIELQDIVVFHGFKSGEELDEIYNNSDIALSSLGEYKRGLEKAAILKVREYCARGIPFILGYQDDSFEKNLPFYYQVPNDESLLDIEKIIEWYKNLKITPKEIRKYAEENVTWNKQMKKIIDEIK